MVKVVKCYAEQHGGPVCFLRRCGIQHAWHRTYKWLHEPLHSLAQICNVCAVPKVHPHLQWLTNSIVHLGEYNSIVCCSSMAVQGATVIARSRITPPCQGSQAGVQGSMRTSQVQRRVDTDCQGRPRISVRWLNSTTASVMGELCLQGKHMPEGREDLLQGDERQVLLYERSKHV